MYKTNQTPAQAIAAAIRDNKNKRNIFRTYVLPKGGILIGLSFREITANKLVWLSSARKEIEGPEIDGEIVDILYRCTKVIQKNKNELIFWFIHLKDKFILTSVELCDLWLNPGKWSSAKYPSKGLYNAVDFSDLLEVKSTDLSDFSEEIEDLKNDTKESLSKLFGKEVELFVLGVPEDPYRRQRPKEFSFQF
jgi:hypothetical protein